MDIYRYLQNNFSLITNEKYRNYDLPYNTKKILCDIGLPYEPVNFLKFNIGEIENIITNDGYIIIGNDFGTNICINNRGEIISVDPQKEYPERFINKNLETLVKFIIIFISYEDKIINSDEDKIYYVIHEIEKEFAVVDAQALSNEENWWPLILEQICV